MGRSAFADAARGSDFKGQMSIGGSSSLPDSRSGDETQQRATLQLIARELTLGTTKIRILGSMRRIGIGAIAGFLVASCGNHGKSITVDLEILLPDVEPRVDAIARTRDGGFVVTGFGATAWVDATDSHGTPLWKFVDPIVGTMDTGSQ